MGENVIEREMELEMQKMEGENNALLPFGE